MNSIEGNTKKAWNENWKPHEVEKLLEIFSYPRVQKQISLYLQYLPKGEKILEGGCGLGPYLIYLHKLGYDITGVDYNQEPLDKIRQYDKTLQVEAMDVRSLRFPDNSFGAYLSLGVIEHFPEGPDKAIQEACRILRPGGVFIVQVPVMNMFLAAKYPVELLRRNRFLRRISGRQQKVYYWQQYFTARRLKEILERQKFSVEKIVPMDHEHSVISFSAMFRDKKSYDGANKMGLAVGKFCEKFLPWISAANIVLICRKI